MPSPDGIDGISKLPTIKQTTGGTTYIVTAEYSMTATENAVQKIRRMILNDLKNVS